MYVTSSIMNGLKGRKKDYTVQFVRVSGQFLSSLEVYSGESALLITKKYLFKEFLPFTFNISNPLFLSSLRCTQITMLFMCIWVSINDTEIKQICKQKRWDSSIVVYTQFAYVGIFLIIEIYPQSIRNSTMFYKFQFWRH